MCHGFGGNGGVVFDSRTIAFEATGWRNGGGCVGVKLSKSAVWTSSGLRMALVARLSTNGTRALYELNFRQHTDFARA